MLDCITKTFDVPKCAEEQLGQRPACAILYSTKVRHLSMSIIEGECCSVRVLVPQDRLKRAGL